METGRVMATLTADSIAEMKAEERKCWRVEQYKGFNRSLKTMVKEERKDTAGK